MENGGVEGWQEVSPAPLPVIFEVSGTSGRPRSLYFNSLPPAHSLVPSLSSHPSPSFLVSASPLIPILLSFDASSPPSPSSHWIIYPFFCPYLSFIHSCTHLSIPPFINRLTNLLIHSPVCYTYSVSINQSMHFILL